MKNPNDFDVVKEQKKFWVFHQCYTSRTVVESSSVFKLGLIWFREITWCKFS